VGSGEQRLTERKPVSDKQLALCLFALLFSVYLLTFSGVYHSSDEMSMLAVTDSLARRGAWDIELLHWMGEQQGSFGPDGTLYSRKGIGTTLAALPTYWLAVQSRWLGNVQAAMLTNGLVTALSGVLVYFFLRRLRYGQGVSLGAALAFGLATMAWPYARYLFSESLAGLGLMASAYFLLRFRDEQDRASPLLASAGLGVALLARLNNALAAPFLGLLLLAYLYRRHGRNWRAYIRPILLFGLPLLAALAAVGWYNWLRFGNPLTTGYLPEERFATPFFEGFYGLTLSPGKGLLWYNPILFAALAAWPFFFRRHRAEALLVAAVVLGNVAFYASWYLWWAGHAWGPRFLVTILPFAILPLAEALQAAARRRALAAGLGLLLAASLAVQVLGVAVDFNLYLEDVHAELGLYHPGTLFNPAYSPLLRQWAYLRPENLDLAWARGGALNWLALLEGVLLVLVSALALRSAWHKRSYLWLGAGLPALLALEIAFSLIQYAPRGDVAAAARHLATMERPGEAAALTDSLRTEAFQDAYDGRLWVWGVPARGEVAAGQRATWSVGPGDPAPAAARFQLGDVRLDYYAPLGQPFDVARLAAQPAENEASLGGAAKLAAWQLEKGAARPGETLALDLYWRAIAPLDTSYTVFVQIVNQDGIKATQLDHLPCDGGCPTDTWRPGDLVGQTYHLPIGASVPAGRYRLIAGLYDLESGENLPLLDAQGNVLGSYLELGSVQIEP
jgi:hypothetical protein